MCYREIERFLIRDGWELVRSTGSHFQFKHPKKKGTVTVPFHGNKDISMGTIRSIEKQSGLRFTR